MAESRVPHTLLRQMQPGDGTHRPLIVVFSSLVPQQQQNWISAKGQMPARTLHLSYLPILPLLLMSMVVVC